MIKTILLYSGWQTINIGDIGHTLGTLRILERHLPDVDVILWAMCVNDAVEALHRRRFPNVRIVRGELNEKSEPTSRELREAFARADMLIINSKPGVMPRPMEYCRRIGKPFGCYGHSYERKEFADHPEYRDLFGAAAFIYCRDSATLRTIKGAGVRCPLVEFGPDGCFGIDVRDDERALPWLRAHGLIERQFITVMLRTNTPKHPTNDEPLNPQRPTEDQKRHDEERAEKLRELIVAWVRKTGMKVLIAPEVDKEIVHNKRLLFDPLPDDVKRRVVNRDTFWIADEAASVFARAHTVICHEPHSCIIALAMGTPVLHPRSLVHGAKGWMFKDIGLAKWLFNLDAVPAGQVFNVLMSIRNDYGGALLKVRKAMNYVERRQAETMRTIRRAIGG